MVWLSKAYHSVRNSGPWGSLLTKQSLPPLCSPSLTLYGVNNCQSGQSAPREKCCDLFYSQPSPERASYQVSFLLTNTVYILFSEDLFSWQGCNEKELLQLLSEKVMIIIKIQNLGADTVVQAVTLSLGTHT